MSAPKARASSAPPHLAVYRVSCLGAVTVNELCRGPQRYLAESYKTSPRYREAIELRPEGASVPRRCGKYGLPRQARASILASVFGFETSEELSQ